ncbi:hypothetical protein Tco_0712271 [Tanacetum coccineum]
MVLSDEEDDLVSEAPSKQGRIEETEGEDQSVQDQSTSSFEVDLSLLSAAKILAEASNEKVMAYKKRRRSAEGTAKGTGKGIFSTAEDIQGTDEEVARKVQKEEHAKELDINWKTIVEQVQERQSGSMIRYQTLKKKPITVAQARKNMMIYLKNMANYKITYFKGMSYDQIRPIFEKEYNKESFKKLRSAQALSSKPIPEHSTEEPKELSEEDLKKMMEIVPVEEVKAEALQVKYPIID